VSISHIYRGENKPLVDVYWAILYTTGMDISSSRLYLARIAAGIY
jgi:hypothetical protein